MISWNKKSSGLFIVWGEWSCLEKRDLSVKIEDLKCEVCWSLLHYLKYIMVLLVGKIYISILMFATNSCVGGVHYLCEFCHPTQTLVLEVASLAEKIISQQKRWSRACPDQQKIVNIPIVQCYMLAINLSAKSESSLFVLLPEWNKPREQI